MDGLRALAVMAVIAFHMSETLLPSGYLGVDIFFVISGYVITLSLLGIEHEPFSTYISTFYTRRIKRLLPALALCVAVTSVAAYMVNTIPAASFKTGALSLFGLSNFYLLFQSEDYFAAPAAFNHFTHTWSLAVEEQFYLLFPILLFFVKGTKARIGALAVITAISLAAYLYLSRSSPMAAFYLSPIRFWELGAGCLLALTRLRTPYPIVPLIIVLGALSVSQEMAESFPGGTTIAVVAATAWLISAMERPGGVRIFFSATPVVYIGRISYSLYLWHWSVLSVGRWLTEPTHTGSIIMLALMFALAIISYHLVEQPIRYGKFPVKRVLQVGASSAGVLGALIGALSLTVPSAYRPPDFTLGMMQARMPCHLPKDKDPLAKCLSRSENDKRTIFVIGDSHASNIAPSLEAATEGHFSIRYLGDSGVYGHHLAKKADFLAQQIRPGDFVLYTIWRSRLYVAAFKGSRRGKEVPARVHAIENSLRYLKGKVESAGGELVFVTDVPQLCEYGDGPFLYTSGKIKECAASEDISYDDQKPLIEIYERTGGQILDPHGELCAGGVCTMYLKGRQLYGDAASHFTHDNPAPLTSFFKQWMDGLVTDGTARAAASPH